MQFVRLRTQPRMEHAETLIQRRILAILWLVPVYAVTSWLSLVFPIMSGGLGVIKDCYEAYAVYTFFAFLVAVLKGVKDVDVNAWSDDTHLVEILIKHGNLIFLQKKS